MPTFTAASSKHFAPAFEAVALEPTASWAFSHREWREAIPFAWHYHSEYALTLTLNSQGYRYIGEEVSEYGDNDLVLMRSGIAHGWRSVSEVREGQGHQVMVITFSRNWLDQLIALFPEMARISGLFAQPFQALVFSADASRRARRLILEMLDCNNPRRGIHFLDVLLELAGDRSAHAIGVSAVPPTVSNTQQTRVFKALRFLHQNYQRTIKLAELADVTCLSISGFQRMFKRHTHTCPADYLMALRVAKACVLLVNTDRSVGSIANEVGYTNVSLFNRQFLKLKNEKPKAYRSRYAASMATPRQEGRHETSSFTTACPTTPATPAK